eukprot:7774294-Pyramimonas_sp.AAC.1
MCVHVCVCVLRDHSKVSVFRGLPLQSAFFQSNTIGQPPPPLDLFDVEVKFKIIREYNRFVSCVFTFLTQATESRAAATEGRGLGEESVCRSRVSLAM